MNKLGERSSANYTWISDVESDSISILAVDDDSSILDLTATFLEREQEDFNVIKRTRADKALEELESGELSVDAIVSDFDMPAMDGLEFLEGVREVNQDLPFILFTGKGSEEIASDAISSGVTDYLQKGTGSSQYSVLANRVENVVEKYRTQKELEESEQKFSKLVENSSDLISIVSDEGRFEYVSPSCTHLVGYSQEEMVGDSVFNYVHPDDRQYVMEKFFEGVENADKTPIVHFRLDNPEMDEVILESRGTNLLEDELVNGFVVNTRDITDLKMREKDLQYRNEQLENVKDLISHDIKNPLNAAMSRIDLYRETGDEKHIESVDEALERMETIIEQTNILADQPVRIEATDKTSLKDAVRSAWNFVDTDDAELRVEDSKLIQANRDRLIQLFENLISNAVQHGGDDATCYIGTTDEGFYFEDDGAGVPEDDQELAFESGFTTDSQNMGLGLTIVNQIVVGHEWEIELTTGEKGGARFEVYGVEFQPTVYKSSNEQFD